MVDAVRLRSLRPCRCPAAVVLAAALGAGCAAGPTAEEGILGGAAGSGEVGQVTGATSGASQAVRASEADIASALDNYRVLWDQRAVPAGDGCDTGWRRQVGEAFDGVDSLVLVGGCAEHAVGILSFVESPATLRFRWNADVGSGDVLAFEASPLSGGTAAVREEAGHTAGWEQVEVALTEPGGYELAWSYVKNGFDDPAVGPGAVALDRVEIEGIDGSSYGEIEIEVSEEAEDGSREMAWATLPGRGYQLFSRRGDREGAEWEKDQEPMRADGEQMSVTRPRVLYEDRVYRVELVEPPSFVTVPDEPEIRRIEGSEVSLSYEVVGGDPEVAPVRWIWAFRKSADGELQSLPEESSTLELGPLSEEHEGIYSLTVTNGAGSESAPAGDGGSISAAGRA